ncbi:zf-TFIIB domain-containing protein [Actinopolymorpha sp. B9G3]|uniref:TFIIB-type zinc ribbon-containing protein n=1 Tax=Actinopolymorpha sp. B9G3 TaxID=3158970 RepID=UPI0032D924D4
MTQLSCPKCHGVMRQYERSGVHIDQCTDCRGIFLDRGELERLSDAETRWHSEQRSVPSEHRGPSGYTQHRDDHRYGSDDRHGYGRRYGSDDRHGYGGQYGHGKKRKRSFLDDLFD